jgi:hypothetical protein
LDKLDWLYSLAREPVKTARMATSWTRLKAVRKPSEEEGTRERIAARMSTVIGS